MSNFIPVNEPLIGSKEHEYVQECLETGWISSEGPFVKEFEKQFSKSVNRKFGISCSSGTAALDIAIKSLKIGPGDEIIIPTFTIISCVSAVVRAGATPVLVDCDPITFNAKPKDILSAITKKTIAIMLVHIYGLPVDMNDVLEYAREHSIYIIEDSAELIGAKYFRNPCGSFGDVSTFSFYSNKHITTGEGGMVVTNNLQIAEKAKSLRNLSFIPQKRFIHYELGWNYRMTNLQAALGLAQLEDLENRVSKKRWIGETYNKFIKKNSLLQTPLENTEYAENIYWVYSLVINKKLGSAEQFRDFLQKHGIGSRPFFYPMHKQPIFRNLGLFEKDNFPNSEKLYEQGLYIPSGLTLDLQKIKYISETINKYLINQ